MKDIILQVLKKNVVKSVLLESEEDLAQKIVDALGPYARIDDIGSRTEYAKSSG